MNKKLQVFVSSTYTDLIEERQAAVQAILDAGHIPAGMELFKAGKSQMKTIKRWIDESDVYMLILGGRYGSIEKESGLSYTELEYRYALFKNMPVFAIILDDSFLFTKAASSGKDSIFEKNNVDKYITFKKYVETNIVKFPNNIYQISTIIHSQLDEIIFDPEYKLIGWTKNNNPETLCENNLNYNNMFPLKNAITILDNIRKYLNIIHKISSEDLKQLYILFNNFCDVYDNNSVILSSCVDVDFYIYNFKNSNFYTILASNIQNNYPIDKGNNKEFYKNAHNLLIQTQYIADRFKVQFTNYALNLI